MWGRLKRTVVMSTMRGQGPAPRASRKSSTLDLGHYAGLWVSVTQSLLTETPFTPQLNLIAFFTSLLQPLFSLGLWLGNTQFPKAQTLLLLNLLL